MQHPIFDAREYPYSITEAYALYEALCQAYPKSTSAQTVYLRCGGPAGKLFIEQEIDGIWLGILRILASNSKLQVLRTFLNNNNIPDYLKKALEVAEAVPLTPGQTPDHSQQQMVLSSKTVVLDRKKVVLKLNELLDNKNFISVLFVGGGDKSGKSHTKHIFDYYRDNQKTISANISSKTDFALNDVLRRLFGKVMAVAPTIPLTTDRAWYETVCGDLRLAVEKKGTVLWIIIDDIRKLDKPIKEFFDQFVALMDQYEYRQFFRLVLIDYPGEKQPAWSTEYLEDVLLDACDIEQKHIKEAIEFWCKKHARQMFETQINEKANEIFQLACSGNSPCPQLELIHSHLLKYFEDLSNDIQ